MKGPSGIAKMHNGSDLEEEIIIAIIKEKFPIRLGLFTYYIDDLALHIDINNKIIRIWKGIDYDIDISIYSNFIEDRQTC